MSGFTDRNADQVHAFALQTGNLGLARVAELMLSMFESGVWRDFSDGTGRYRFLPGELDYFLTQQGVTRDQVMHGVRDVEIKARLEEAMDERRTGELEYRRELNEARQQLPDRPGRPIEPFGLRRSEVKLVEGGTPRPPLGRAPRQFRRTGGATTKRPNEQLDRIERLRRSIVRLNDADLTTLAEAIDEEKQRRNTSEPPPDR